MSRALEESEDLVRRTNSLLHVKADLLVVIQGGLFRRQFDMPEAQKRDLGLRQKFRNYQNRELFKAKVQEYIS